MRRIPWIAAAAALTFSSAASADLGADGGEPRPATLEEAQHHIEAFEYDAAHAIADGLLRAGHLSHTDYVQALRIVGVTAAFLGGREEAKNGFADLLYAEPDFALDPNLSPRVQEPFLEARGDLRALGQRPGLDASATARQGNPLLVRTVLRDPRRRVVELQVGGRGGDRPYTVVTRPAAGELRAEVAAIDPADRRVDFYALAIDGNHNVVFEAANALAPRTVFVEVTLPPPRGEPEKRGGIWGSPLFWVAVGVLVGGGGVTATAVALGGSKTQTVTDPPKGATLMPTLLCGGTRCL